MDRTTRLLVIAFIVLCCFIAVEIVVLIRHSTPSNQLGLAIGNPSRTAPSNTELFIAPNGQPASLGFLTISSDQANALFIGKVVKISQRNGVVYASVKAQSPSGKTQVQQVLVYDSGAHVPFIIEKQHVHALFPPSSQYVSLSLSTASQVIDALSMLTNQDIIFYLDLRIPPAPSLPPAMQPAIAVTKKYLACNQEYLATLQDSSAHFLSCTPYVAQISIYAP